MIGSFPSLWRQIILCVALLQPLLPLYWALVTSFRKGSDLFSTALFTHLYPGNYGALLSSPIWWHDAANSLLSASATTLLTLLLAIPAAYALGRMSFQGRRAILALLLGCAMLPQIAILSGLFTVISALGLYNHLGSLIFADLFFALPFAIWLLAGFFRDLPRDLDDAGILDGCTMIQRLLWLHLPLVWPGLAATGLLTFITCWNEFLSA